MASTERRARPRFTSVKTYKHAAGHPTFWYPPEWQLQETDTPHPAVSLYPDPSDEATFISITVQDMGQPLAAEESSLLAEGIEEGLNQLEECVVERWATGARSGFAPSCRTGPPAAAAPVSSAPRNICTRS